MIWSRRSCCMKIIGHCWQPEEIRRENCTQQLDNKPKQVGKRTPRWYCNSLRRSLVSFLLLIREMDGSPEWYYDIHVMICVFLEVGKDMKTWTKPLSKGGHTTDAMPAMLMRWFDLIMRYTFCDIQCKVCRSDGPAGLSWKILKVFVQVLATRESRFQKRIRSLWLPNNDNYITSDRNLGSLFSSFHGSFRW